MKRVRLSSKVRKAFQGSSRGLTLIEVLIAMALVGIIAITFLSALTTASTALAIADRRATAESLARSQMEDVKNQDYDFTEPQDYEQDYVQSMDHPNYFISVSAEPLRNPDDGIQKITVTVSHNDKVVFTLESYKEAAGAEPEE